jgi:hypothetical protein
MLWNMPRNISSNNSFEMEYEDEPCVLSEYNGSQMTQHASYSVEWMVSDNIVLFFKKFPPPPLLKM